MLMLMVLLGTLLLHLVLAQTTSTLHIFPTLPPDPTYYTPSRTTTTLTPASTVPVGASMGLVVPRAFPYKDIYLGGHELGWVEVAPAHPPIVGGWMRMVSPVVVLPDYTVQTLPVVGSENPRDPFYYPLEADMCASYAVTAHINTYGFNFTQTGWHMLVVNQTWIRPTMSDGTCHLPLVDTNSFFATALISIAPLPTRSQPRPTGAYTTWIRVTTETPGSLPYPPANWGTRERIAVGLGVGLGGTGALLGLLAMLWIQRWRYNKFERMAFDHMKPEEQHEYLATNPRSVLNPNPPPNRLVVWIRELRADVAIERARKEAAMRVPPPYPPVHQPGVPPQRISHPPPQGQAPLLWQTPRVQIPYHSQQLHPHFRGLPAHAATHPPYVPHVPHPPHPPPHLDGVRTWQEGLPRRFKPRAVS